MTDRPNIRHRALAHEILGLIGISAALALVLFWVLTNVAGAAAEVYCFEHDIVMTEFDWMEADTWIFSLSSVICAVFFSVLFLTLLGERLVYIRRIIGGIDALRTGQGQAPIPLEGCNELTELADAVNYLSAAQRQMREREQTLAREKEQLIRTLSHDIRTPLTAIVSYAAYMEEGTALSERERANYLGLIRKKADQIRVLTDILLDGGGRSPERFDDARLLFAQLAEELAEDLEERFRVHTDLSGCPEFAGIFDVQQLRRIFDNIGSNIHRYADPAGPVCLTIRMEDGTLVIRQTNAVRSDAPQAEGYRLGIRSIRRIAQHYGGSVSVGQEAEVFSITVTLSSETFRIS